MTALDLLPNLDSLVAGLLIGTTLGRWPERLRWAWAFGWCDGAASWLGGLAPGMFAAHSRLALCAATIAVACMSRHLPQRGSALCLLPLALAADNLAAAPGGPAWWCSGLASAALALAGIAGAAALRAAPPPRTIGSPQ